jgi:hypothetical protein
MGQYHYVINQDKREFLHPHKFNDGLKLLEFSSGGLTTMALASLLATSNGRGGGDLHADHPLIGSWAGDRIVIVGDYYQANDVAGTDNPWMEPDELSEPWTDISDAALDMLRGDEWIASRIKRAEEAEWSLLKASHEHEEEPS